MDKINASLLAVQFIYAVVSAHNASCVLSGVRYGDFDLS